ncbi:MAG: amidohydrolase family protein [Chloroflexi bacterium]|nr:amidohydrolase family protein [Chloroflexota bacterium]
MPDVDLVIRHGEIVTAAGSAGCADIGIADGKIVQIGGTMDGQSEIDARGKLVLPGGIDAHVHLSLPPEDANTEPRWVDDFTSGSAAALAGGITTLGNMTFPGSGESLFAQLQRETKIAREQTIADLFLHPVLDDVTPRVLDEIPRLLGLGCNSIKVFTVSPRFDSQEANYREAIRRAGENGLLTLMHCEDRALIESATARLVAEGKSSLRYYAESRPVISEVMATQRAIAIAEATGAPIYIVHLSSARALDDCVQAQSRNIPIYVETRPLYLFLTQARFHDEDGGKYVGQPPLREQHDVDALWAGLREGVIHTVCTDHAPWSLAAKLDPAHSIGNVRPGVPDLQTMLPMLYSEGVRSGRISLARFVQVTSTNAAKLFGLYPRKGTIAVGSDADLTLFDPDLTRVIDRSNLYSNSDYSAFDGWRVTGFPTITIRAAAKWSSGMVKSSVERAAERSCRVGPRYRFRAPSGHDHRAEKHAAVLADGHIAANRRSRRDISECVNAGPFPLVLQPHGRFS